MLLTPEALYVANCHDPSARHPQARAVEGFVAAIEEDAPHFDLCHRLTEHAAVVASSGFAQPEGGGRQFMANNFVLVVDRATLAVEQAPLDVRFVGSPPTVAGPTPARPADPGDSTNPPRRRHGPLTPATQ